MSVAIPTVPAEYSTRTEELSPEERAAALRAIHRILVVARDVARRGADPADLERLLDSVEHLPTMLLRPAEFDDLFATTLDDLGTSFPALHGLRDEYEADL